MSTPASPLQRHQARLRALSDFGFLPTTKEIVSRTVEAVRRLIERGDQRTFFHARENPGLERSVMILPESEYPTLKDRTVVLMTKTKKHNDPLIHGPEIHGPGKKIKLAFNGSMHPFVVAVVRKKSLDECLYKDAKRLAGVYPELNRLPNMARIIHHVETPEASGKYYFLQPFYPLGDVTDAIISGLFSQFSLDQQLQAMICFIEALSQLHQAGFVHRDVKPENLFLLSMGETRLGDPDYVRRKTDEEAKKQRIGTAGYGAPEYIGFSLQKYIDGLPQNRLEDLDREKIDLWAAGCVLYIMLTRGGLPWGLGRSNFRLRTSDWETHLETIRGAMKEHPLAPIILRLLSLDPTKRPPAAEVLEVLRAYQMQMRNEASGRSAAGPAAPAGTERPVADGKESSGKA